MILVLDSSALITLSRIGQLELLERLGESLHIPQAVHDEVSQPPGHVEGLPPWVIPHQVRDREAVERLTARLGRGEAEAIVLAKELQANSVVLDDATARRTAEAEGCHVVGLLGLVVLAKERGLIPAVKPIVDRMLAAGFYLDDELYRTVLKASQEH